MQRRCSGAPSGASIASSQRSRLFDPKQPNKLLIQEKGLSTDWSLYVTDLFHTLLHMSRRNFIMAFILLYFTKYALFAALYLPLAADGCLIGVDHWIHAFWFAVQTSTTIGYGGLAPNPKCFGLNMMVTFQAILSMLMDYSVLGVVYARFASPVTQAPLLRFSQHLAMYLDKDDMWCFSFRLGNIRKRQILKPEVRLMLAMHKSALLGDDSLRAGGGGNRADSGGGYLFKELEVEFLNENIGCLWLGLPAVVTHTVRPGSPLFSLSLEEMHARCMEILVLVDGTDAMTSSCIEARHAYCPSDIRVNACFGEEVMSRDGSGRIGVDFTCFDEMTASNPASQSSRSLRRTHTPSRVLWNTPFRDLKLRRMDADLWHNEAAERAAEAAVAAVLGGKDDAAPHAQNRPPLGDAALPQRVLRREGSSSSTNSFGGPFGRRRRLGRLPSIPASVSSPGSDASAASIEDLMDRCASGADPDGAWPVFEPTVAAAASPRLALSESPDSPFAAAAQPRSIDPGTGLPPPLANDAVRCQAQELAGMVLAEGGCSAALRERVLALTSHLLERPRPPSAPSDSGTGGAQPKLR